MAPRLRSGSELVVEQAPLRPAAALMLLYEHGGDWYVPLTVRGAALRHHTGQISLPGGRVDGGESIEGAAVREAQEEVGVSPSAVEVLGRLTPLPVWISGHLLYPVVGVARERPAFSLAIPEVERLVEVPLVRLLQPDVVHWETRTRATPPYETMDVPYFDVPGARVWGATAMVLAEFLALVEGFGGVPEGV